MNDERTELETYCPPTSIDDDARLTSSSDMATGAAIGVRVFCVLWETSFFILGFLLGGIELCFL